LGQAVTVHHRNADEFLRRDCKNVANFFARQGLDVAGEDLYEYVTAVEADPSADLEATDGPTTEGSSDTGGADAADDH
jgi:RIO kinase 1